MRRVLAAIFPVLIAGAAGASECGQPSGQFGIIAGAIYGPDKGVFVPRGVNIAANNLAQWSGRIASLMPGLDFIRAPVYSFDDPSTFASAVQALTSQHIVVEFEYHMTSNGANNGGSQGDVFTGQLLASDLAWYASMAKFFASNPYVWYGTTNEPPSGDGNALAAWQKAEYDAVRSGAPNAIVLLEISGSLDANSNLPQSVYAQMDNVAWDAHYYGWVPRYSTDPAQVTQALNQVVTNAQRITSAGPSVMPVIIGEFGDSTTGMAIDPNGSQVIDAVTSSPYGFAAWWLAVGQPGDGLLDGSGGSLSQFGRKVASAISSGASAATTATGCTTVAVNQTSPSQATAPGADTQAVSQADADALATAQGNTANQEDEAERQTRGRQSQIDRIMKLREDVQRRTDRLLQRKASGAPQ